MVLQTQNSLIFTCNCVFDEKKLKDEGTWWKSLHVFCPLVNVGERELLRLLGVLSLVQHDKCRTTVSFIAEPNLLQ